MKQTVCIVLLLALLLSACSAERHTPTIPAGNYSYDIFALQFSARNISSNHVGNNWVFTYTHDGKTIQDGYTIIQSVEIFTFQFIGVEVREKDIFDDVGTGELIVPLCAVGTDKTEVTVTETHGFFKGRTAVWEITCKVELVGKLQEIGASSRFSVPQKNIGHTLFPDFFDRCTQIACTASATGSMQAF